MRSTVLLAVVVLVAGYGVGGVQTLYVNQASMGGLSSEGPVPGTPQAGAGQSAAPDAGGNRPAEFQSPSCDTKKPISEPQIINKSGCYVILSNLTYDAPDSNFPLEIRANDVVIKGGNNWIWAANGVYLNNSQDVTLENANIGWSYVVHSDRSTLKNVYALSMLRINQSDGFTIANSRLDSYTPEIDRSDRAAVVDSYINTTLKVNSSTGVVIQDTFFDRYGRLELTYMKGKRATNGAEIIDNTFKNSGSAIGLWNSDGVVIRNNTLDDTGWLGIYLEDDSDNNVLTGNEIRGTAGYGIDIDETSEQNVVRDNVILNHSETGLLVEGSNTTIRNNVIAYNDFRGVSLDGDYARFIGNNVSFNDDPTNSTTDFTDGIHVDSNNVTIRNNRIQNNTGAGISILGSAGRNTNISVTNTTIAHNGEDGIATRNIRKKKGPRLRNVRLIGNDGHALHTDEASRGGLIRAENVTLGPPKDPVSVEFQSLNVDIAAVPTPPPDPAHASNVSAYVSVIDNYEVCQTRSDFPDSCDDTASYVFLNVSYSGSAAGSVNESVLRLWRHNTSWQRAASPNDVNTSANYTYANLTKFGVVTPLATAVNTPMCSGCSLPKDPDDDGVFEDIDGNGKVDFTDVVLLYQEQEEGDASLAFDFDENGKIDFTDVVLLYQEQD